MLIATAILAVQCAGAMDPVTRDLLTPIRKYGEGCGYEACPAPREGMVNVHIVPHSHAELGYSRTFENHYTGYDEFYDRSNINMQRILDATISELWSHKERTFTLSDSEIPYFFHWWARRDGTVHRMVYQLLRQGRLYFVGGGWGMADEASTSYQGIIDQFTYTLRKLNASFLECGRPLVAWQADTFGHSRELTALLAQMGYDGLFINPISFDDELHRMRSAGLEFVWRGSDDLGRETDVFTHKLFDGYWSPPGFCFGSMCGDPLLITSDSVFSNADERTTVFLEAVLQRQAPHYSSPHVMVMMGQRFGYHDAMLWFANIDKLINLVNKRGYEAKTGSRVHLHYSTPACYLKAVHAASPVLQTKQDDFFPFAYDQTSYAVGMYTSRPTLKYMLREGNVYLQMAKQLQVLARLGGNDKLFEQFNWVMGVLQDHNVISGALRISVKNYYTKLIYDAVQASTVLLRQAFNKLRGSSTKVYYRCSFNISSCNIFTRRRSSISIYNPLAWPVSMAIRLPVTKEEYVVFDHKGSAVKTAMMKISVPVLALPERNTKADHELVFIAKDLPPLGLRSYLIERLGIRRAKKSLIKKLKKNKQTKYYIRQTNPYSFDNKTLFVADEEYENYDDVTTEGAGEVQIGNIPKETARDNDYVMTPKPRKEVINAINVTEEEVTTAETTERVTENYEFHADNIFDTDIKYLETVSERTDVKPTRTPKATTNPTGFATSTDKDIENVRTTHEKTESFRKHVTYYEESGDDFIENKYIKISIDKSTRKVARVALSNGVNTSLDIQFYFYASDDPVKMDAQGKKPPGAYIFRPMDVNPEPIIDYVHTKVLKTDLVNEIHCTYSNYTSFAVRLYEDSPVVELDWVAGPVPIDDDIGKEVFIRYTTDLVNDGVFYTDANGRQTMKRIRHTRATYEPVNFDPISGNIYPVTSKIYIEDKTKNIRLSIFNDRSQGGTSLYDGAVDLMVHRRILTDDNGIQAYLNETVDGQGIVVRGKHFIYLSKADYRPNKVFEKKFAKEIELAPQIFADGDNVPNKTKWMEYNNEVVGLKSKLPIGVHVLTIEEWNEGTILIRLENYLEKADTVKRGHKRVFLKDLFVGIKIEKVKETTLAGNIWLENWVPLHWNTSTRFVKNFNDYYGNRDLKIEYGEDEELKPLEDVVLDEGVSLRPQQIRTFVVWFTYIDKSTQNSV